MKIKAKKKLKKYMTKGIRKIRNRKGFGVHSPFAFNFITFVIGEKSHYYAYDEICKARNFSNNKKRLAPGITYKSKISKKKLFLIYRVLNFFKSYNIVEAGNRGGLITYILYLANMDCKVTSFDENRKSIEKSKTLISNNTSDYTIRESGDSITYTYKNKQITLLNTSYKNGFKEATTHNKIDFLYIHKKSDIKPSDMEGYLANCFSDNSVIIIDGIHSDKNNMELWQLMKKNEKVRVTMDLYEPGIAIFNEKLFKKHYIVSF